VHIPWNIIENGGLISYANIFHIPTNMVNRNINRANKVYENVAMFKYLEVTQTMSRLNSEMLATIRFRIFCLPTCYSKTKIKIYRTIILPVDLYGCEIWTLPLGEEHMLSILKNWVQRKIEGPKMEEVREG
jgi:hypothetical protein